MNNQIFITLSSLLSLLGLAYLLFWRYRALCMDSFRQSVFELRDELFDYAASGHIDFDHPAYGVLRNTMNGYIRFAHHMTAWYGIIFTLMLSKADREHIKDQPFESVWSKSTSQLAPEVRKQLESFRYRMDRAVFFYFLVSCPELILLISPALLVLGVLFLVSKVGAIRVVVRFKKRFSESDNFALLYGESAT
jgi:hypothetical protein